MTPTHPPRRTISRAEARPRTLALVWALRDIIKLEEAWAIAQDFLDEECAETLVRIDTWKAAASSRT